MDSEWINVTPGKRPDLPATFNIKIRQRNGEESVHPVGFVSFNHSGGPADVVAYTVAERPIIERDIKIKTPDLRVALLEAELTDHAALLTALAIKLEGFVTEQVMGDIKARIEAAEMLIGDKETGVSQLLVSCPHCFCVIDALGDQP